MTKAHAGGCHCGAVRFECELDAAAETSRCSCSICAKGRFWKTIARKDAFRLVKGADMVTEYGFSSGTIRHCFCRRCGIKPFGRGNMEALGGVFYAVTWPASMATHRCSSRCARSSFRTARTTTGRSRPPRRATSELKSHLLEHFDEAVDILFVVVDVRTDPETT